MPRIRLAALAAAGVAFCLAVGGSASGASFGTDPDNGSVVFHWDGTAWTKVPFTVTPTPGVVDRLDWLSGVAAISPSDAWAVGQVQSRRTRPLAEHWDGSAWSEVPVPGVRYGHLHSVAATSADDVWAVGDSQGYLRSASLIEHWDGTSWHRVTSPSPGRASTLNGVTALSPSDAWAVGSSDSKTLALHWDGQRWSLVASPNLGSPERWPGNELSAVSAVAHRNVWAVGHHRNPWRDRVLVLHWNGRVWHQVPGRATDGHFLAGVANAGRNAVWAVGGDAGCPPLIERWSGHRPWSIVPARTPSSWTACTFHAVAAVSPDDVWAAGGVWDDSTHKFLGAVEHWDGSSWTPVAFPQPPGDGTGFGGYELNGIAASSARDVWAVGFAF